MWSHNKDVVGGPPCTRWRTKAHETRSFSHRHIAYITHESK